MDSNQAVKYAIPVRASLKREIEVAWTRLASAGTWWTGVERLAISAEARHAPHCDLCAQRKKHLSPSAVEGKHEHLGFLTEPVVEAIHRLVTDAGRITERWIRSLDLDEQHYVEMIGVIAVLTGLDTFDRAVGQSLRPLPTPISGDPTRHKPTGANKTLAWVATLSPESVTTKDPNPYPIHGDKNIHRALSLVPQEVFNFFDLDVELYLKDYEIRDFTKEFRAISHTQIELIAGRTSALAGCFY